MVNASKGEGIAFLRQATGATAVVFAGDDTTDEDALGSLVPGDLGVKVGLDFTQAEFRVESTVHICELLEALLRERKRAAGHDCATPAVAADAKWGASPVTSVTFWPKCHKSDILFL